MIFTYFKGPVKPDEKLTEGRVYYTRLEMDSGAAVMANWVEVQDDEGQVVRLKNDDRVVLAGKCYGVVLREMVHGISEILPGKVVLLEGSDDFGSICVNIPGGIFVQTGWRDHIELIDAATLRPGMRLGAYVHPGGKKELVLKWQIVRQVVIHTANDGILPEVWLEGRELKEFIWQCRFPVSQDGEILVSPVVKCVEAAGSLFKAGGVYELASGLPGDGLLEIAVSDGSCQSGVAGSRFQWV